MGGEFCRGSARPSWKGSSFFLFLFLFLFLTHRFDRFDFSEGSKGAAQQGVQIPSREE